VLAAALYAALAGAPAAAQCVGDCDGNQAVEINNLIVGVNIALGAQPVAACEAFDCQRNGTVPINCLVQGVNNALSGCVPLPTATATVAGPTAAISVTPTSTAIPPAATPTAIPTVTSVPGGPSCSFATAACTTTGCSCGDDPGTDYHIGASGSVTGPVGTELRVNINALGGGTVDCGGWTRIFGNVVVGCDIIGCCQRQGGQPETVQWSVFEVIDFPCFCPEAPDASMFQHNFLIQCQLRPGPVTEHERTSTGCP
jgi:hypothetical protein